MATLEEMDTDAESDALVQRPNLYPEKPSMGLFGWDRAPVVVDTSMLLNDCCDAARGSGGSLLLSLAHSPVAHLYAGRHVLEEMERRLPRRAEQRHLDPVRADTVWRQNYLPKIRFVDMTGVARGRAASALAARDPTDLQTALLAELLAPCLVFAFDKDLVDTGIARRDWVNVSHSAEEAAQLQLLFSGGLGTVMFGGFISYETGKAIAAFARASPFGALLATAGTALLGYRYLNSERGRHHRTEAKSLLGDLFDGLSKVVAQADKAKLLVEEAAFVLEVEPTEFAHLARTVAIAPWPLKATDAAERLGVSQQRAASMLRNPVFVRTTDRRYLFGRSYGVAESEQADIEANGVTRLT
jgi:hypothetical protein